MVGSIEPIKNHTYLVKHREVDVEVGDRKAVSFKPRFKLKRWGDECSLDINFAPTVLEEEEVEEETDAKGNVTKIKYKAKADDYEIEFEYYPVEPIVESLTVNGEVHDFLQNELGGFEWKFTLKQMPPSLVWKFPIQTKGLKFYYQPPLHPDHPTWADTTRNRIPDSFRPENVVGSYAVYHNTKTNIHASAEDAKKYKAGKAFHVYRPHLMDAEGKETWADLDVSDGFLTITLPQEFLDKAVYPVTVDPTFGHTEIGSSGHGELLDNFLHGMRPHVCPVSGIATSISWYGHQFFTAGNIKAAIYKDLDDSLVGITEEKVIPTDNAWTHHNIISGGALIATDYILTLWGSGGFYLPYDTVAGYYRAYRSDFIYNGWPDPAGWTFKTGGEDQKFSVYCTYTPILYILTNVCDQIQDTQVRAKGDIDGLGEGGNCDERGFVYDTSSHGNPGNVSPASSDYPNCVYETDSFGIGNFTLTVSSLTENVTYYIRAYAHNSLGYVYGNEVVVIAGKVEREDTLNADFNAGSHDDTNTKGNTLGLMPIGGGLCVILAEKAETEWGSGWTNPEDPYNTYYHDSRAQFVIPASELMEAGLGVGEISKMHIHVSEQPGIDLVDFRIRMRHTEAMTSNAYIPVNGWILVYGPTTIPKSNLVANEWYEYIFTTNFNWDGLSNLLIDLSRDGEAWAENGGMYTRGNGLIDWMCAGCDDSFYDWPFDDMADFDYSKVPSIKLYIAGSGYKTSGIYTSAVLDISVLDSCDDSLISWSETLNGQTLTVYSRYSINGGDAWSEWAVCTSGQSMPGVGDIGNNTSDALVQYKVEISGDGSATPQLHDINIVCLYGEGAAPPTGWTGKISGVVNPAKIMGIPVENIAKVKGIA